MKGLLCAMAVVVIALCCVTAQAEYGPPGYQQQVPPCGPVGPMLEAPPRLYTPAPQQYTPAPLGACQPAMQYAVPQQQTIVQQYAVPLTTTVTTTQEVQVACARERIHPLQRIREGVEKVRTNMEERRKSRYTETVSAPCSTCTTMQTTAPPACGAVMAVPNSGCGCH
jgi:hypothetical protein